MYRLWACISLSASLFQQRSCKVSFSVLYHVFWYAQCLTCFHHARCASPFSGAIEILIVLYFCITKSLKSILVPLISFVNFSQVPLVQASKIMCNLLLLHFLFFLHVNISGAKPSINASFTVGHTVGLLLDHYWDFEQQGMKWSSASIEHKQRTKTNSQC